MREGGKGKTREGRREGEREGKRAGRKAGGRLKSKYYSGDHKSDQNLLPVTVTEMVMNVILSLQLWEWFAVTGFCYKTCSPQLGVGTSYGELCFCTG